MKYSILIYVVLTSFLMLGQMNEIRLKCHQSLKIFREFYLASFSASPIEY